MKALIRRRRLDFEQSKGEMARYETTKCQGRKKKERSVQ